MLLQKTGLKIHQNYDSFEYYSLLALINGKLEQNLQFHHFQSHIILSYMAPFILSKFKGCKTTPFTDTYT